jgi:hypothetical protein
MTTLTDYNQNRKSEEKGVTKKKESKKRERDGERQKKIELLDIYANKERAENR